MGIVFVYMKTLGPRKFLKVNMPSNFWLIERFGIMKTAEAAIIKDESIIK